MGRRCQRMRMSRIFGWGVLLALFLQMGCADYGGGGNCVIYVSANTGNDADEGASWGTALKSLQEALKRSEKDRCDIWMATGVYKPTTGDDRFASFQLVNKVDIYGGFAVGQTSLEQRDLDANPTVLSGAIGDPHVEDDNSCHVVEAIKVKADLNGVEISGGYGDRGPSPAEKTGGLFIVDSKVNVEDCCFVDNAARHGAAIYAQNSDVEISRTTIEHNCALSGGAMVEIFESNIRVISTDFLDGYQFEDSDTRGIRLASSSGYMEDCVFSGMTCIAIEFRDLPDNGKKPELYIDRTKIENNMGTPISSGSKGTVVITNSIIANNVKDDDCTAVIFLVEGVVKVVNSTIVNNGNRNTNLFDKRWGSLSIENTIVWGNVGFHEGDYPAKVSRIEYSCIENGIQGDVEINNISNFPEFRSWDSEERVLETTDLYLTQESPCVDAADPGRSPQHDFEGKTRDSKPDIGAFEL